MKSLVIVESPTKAKTIKKFLPKNYVVDSSMGHIRDLPASAAEVPAKFKKEKWASLGINVEKDFEPLYVISAEKKKVVKKLKELMAGADELILATDEDREGEGISWHLVNVLEPKIPTKRMVFHEITQEAIEKALTDFRNIDMNLVNAQEARRIIDRLAGYTISPLLWKKIAPGLSAGRVQSVAVELLVDRERERIRFKSAEYWDLLASLNSKNGSFNAEMTHLNGVRLANGKDFDENTGKLKNTKDVMLLLRDQAELLQKSLKTASWSVKDITVSKQKRSPYPPFITSTLQQEANRKFGFSARDTMRIAQKLYENGFITYMRTDSTNLSSQAIDAARSAVQHMYGEKYLHSGVRTYNKKAKGAQEAHEAIRPAGSQFKTPQETGLTSREFKLYDLIWKRTIATQMADALLEFTNVEIEASTTEHKATFKASGKEILFPGFLRAYVEGTDDPEAALDDQEDKLPALNKQEALQCEKISAKSHETKPPARFTEASLVKELEKEGVGRPSTYASIISTIQERGYCKKDGNALVPTFTAFAVTDLLKAHFPELVDIEFTSEMENKLDAIASGSEDWLNYLRQFYLGEKGLQKTVEVQEGKIDPQTARKIDIPLETLEGYEIFIGRYGPYVQTKKNGEVLSTSLPNDMAPAEVAPEVLEKLLKSSEDGPQSIGNDPETGKPIFVLNGRFGPYVQVGLVEEEEAPKEKGKKGKAKEKPKRASLLKGMNPEDVTLEMALRLLSLPRLVGNHPETGKEIRASVGRFGPYVVHDGVFASLKASDNVLEVDLERALFLLNESKAKKAKTSSEPLNSLGAYEGTDVTVLSGRYGPYIKYGKQNVAIPKTVEPSTLTLEQAIALIQKKAK